MTSSATSLPADAHRICASARYRQVLAVGVSYMRDQPDDVAHDEMHLARVISAAIEIGVAEGADLEVLLPAAALHDVVNVPKNHPDREQASAMAADAARPILSEAGYTEKEITAIAQAILEHSFSAGLKPTSLESAVLQDADRLDSLGAFGVLRTASTAARMGGFYHHAADPDAKARELDDRQYMLDHFYKKLLRLPDMMNTAKGREEAQKRLTFMNSFLEEFYRELPAHSVGIDEL